MFSKILIANRGEIACRVIDTCRKLGVETVAIYSDADKNSRHVAMADTALRIGPPAVSESYLQADAIIEAALSVSAEAIHPGFGFLSENPDFVEKVEAAGLTFIGPSADAMRAMGLKDAAKAKMEAADVPVVPGYHGDKQEPSFLAEEADKIGYPVLIKARAGGGGKGMRKVDDPADFQASLESAQREGEASFGDGRVLIEKYINAPRHIEVQVFGDSHGRVVHLFERDCSLQRRHQKVIEEAPAPGMSDEMRAAMTAAAVKAADAINYEGAGTIEFIVDGARMTPDSFWFMEMNTRLQVEHPVTEMITGYDLVEWQLRVAADEPIPVQQEDITINGHAFEARLYAEDAENDFLPATGPLEVLRFPDNARIETGVRQGDDITPYYDPMIAKIITHGPDRASGLAKMCRALDETRVIGTVTNVRFLSRLAAHHGFQAGEVDTGLIARDYASLTFSNDNLAFWFEAALVASGALEKTDGLGAWQLWGAPSWPVTLKFDDEERTLRVVRDGAAFYYVEDGGFSETFEVLEFDGERLRVLSGELIQSYDVWSLDGGKRIVIAQDDRVDTFTLNTGEGSGSSEGAASNQIIAPMPGAVTACHVAVGDKVEKGQPLLVMEAMKMEHALEAQMDGVVAEVSASTGEQVEKGAVLITLEEGA